MPLIRRGYGEENKERVKRIYSSSSEPVRNDWQVQVEQTHTCMAPECGLRVRHRYVRLHGNAWSPRQNSVKKKNQPLLLFLCALLFFSCVHRTSWTNWTSVAMQVTYSECTIEQKGSDRALPGFLRVRCYLNMACRNQPVGAAEQSRGVGEITVICFVGFSCIYQNSSDYTLNTISVSILNGFNIFLAWKTSAGPDVERLNFL